MDKTKIILIILIVIVAVVAIAAIFGMGLTKTDTKITVLSNNSLSQDDQFKIGLQTESGNLEGKTIHFKFIDGKGNVSEYSVDTDVNGKAKLKLKDLDSGNYTVNVTFEGDDKYNSSHASQKLEIKEVVEEPVETQQTSYESQELSSSSSDGGLHYDPEINVYYNDAGVVVDPDGEHPMEVGSQYSDLAERREKWERGELIM